MKRSEFYGHVKQYHALKEQIDHAIQDVLESGTYVRQFAQPEQTTSDGPTTLDHAWTEFIRDAEARNLREPTLNKYRYLRGQMQRFAAEQGFRFVSEFSVEELRKWRSSWPNRNLSALKKLELVRMFLALLPRCRMDP